MLILAEMICKSVAGDGVNPSAKFEGAVVLIKLFEGFDEGIAGEVFYQLAIVADAIMEKAVNFFFVLLVVFCELCVVWHRANCKGSVGKDKAPVRFAAGALSRAI
jgi:hypothetical protein